MATYECCSCHKETSLGVKVDSCRSIPLCSNKCVENYFPNADLTDVQLSKEEFGHHGWILLHTFVLKYDELNVSSPYKIMNVFLDSFSKIYPCTLCRNHFIDMIQQNSPVFKPKKNLVKWLSDRHNEVNRRLGKPEYPCLFESEKHISSNYFISGKEGNLTNTTVSNSTLGQSTWFFLHTLSLYPLKEDTIKWVFLFYRTLALLYPVKEYKSELKLEIRNHLHWALKTEINHKRWIWNFHNRINTKLGKPIYKEVFINENIQQFSCPCSKYK